MLFINNGVDMFTKCYCDGKTKMKLTAIAKQSRLGSSQKFVMRKCCARCGYLIKE